MYLKQLTANHLKSNVTGYPVFRPTRLTALPFLCSVSDSGRSPCDLQDLPTQEDPGAEAHLGHPVLHAYNPALPDPTGVCPEPQGAVHLLNIGQRHHPGEHGSDL